MAVAETARLVAEFDWKDNVSPGVAKTVANVQRLGGSFGKVGAQASKGFAALRHNIGHLASGPLGLVGLAGGIYGVEHAMEETIHAATGFQEQMRLIQTQAGASAEEVDTMSTSVLNLAKSVGTAPETLATALYHVESAGIRGAKALDVLRIAAEGAKVGNADLESVTNALVAAVASGIKGASNMGEAMGALNAVVGAGNMRMQDLADAMGTGLLSRAAAFGVSLKSVGAALADLSVVTGNTQQSATRLGLTISLLGAPTSKAATALKGIGLNATALAKAMRGPEGIVGAVSLLAEHMQKAGLIGADGKPNVAGAQLLSKAFGGGRSSGAILALIGSLGRLRETQDRVNKGAAGFGEAWAATQEEASFKFAQFGAAIQKVQILVGTKLLPTLTEWASALADWLDAHGSELADNISAGAKAITELAKQVASVLIPALQTISNWWNSLPSELRTLLIGGFIANKLTGGAVTGIGGALVSAAIQRAIITRAVTAAVSAGATAGAEAGVAAAAAGGAEAAGGAAAAAAAGGVSTGVIASIAAIAAPVALAVIGAAAVAFVANQISSGSTAQAAGIKANFEKNLPTMTTEQMRESLDGINQGIHDLESNPLNVLVQGDALNQLKLMRGQLEARLPAGSNPGQFPAGTPTGPLAGRTPGAFNRATGQPLATAGRDTDKQLASATQVLQDIRHNGIDLKAIAAQRLASLGQDVKHLQGPLKAYARVLHQRMQDLKKELGKRKPHSEGEKLIAARIAGVAARQRDVANGIKALRTSKNPQLTQLLTHEMVDGDRLKSLQTRLHIAKESGDRGRARALQGKINTTNRDLDQTKAAIARQVQSSGADMTRAEYTAGQLAQQAGFTAARAQDAAASRIVAAIYANRPVIQSTNVTRSTTIVQRAGPTGGSSNTGSTARGVRD